MIGKTISHYKILEKLGEGGMGVVYKAEDTKLKRTIALKFLPPEMIRDPEAKARFIHEAQAASALQHHNICTIHDVDETDDGQIFIVMDCYQGETLKEKLTSQQLAVGKVIELVMQIAAGLQEAHARGIIHRDIKPANIMITDKGEVKIMDFGLAKLAGQTVLTKTGTTVGTAAYMSPEQALGEMIDHRTDIWSLGVLLYEMITGERPFKGEYEQALIYMILNEEPESLLKVRPDAAPELSQIVNQALTKKPADRYQSMKEFREDLTATAEGLKPTKLKRRTRRKIFGLNWTYLLYVALVILLIFFGLNSGGFRDRIFGRKDQAEPAIKLAVLPFVNLSGDPEQEFFSDGITQELITDLGRLNTEGLSVIARTSVMRYKKGDTPIDQVGRELGVDYVLEGSARREASRVRVTAQLIHVSDQAQIWADTYEHDLSGILTVQSLVAQSVAKALAIKLLPAEQVRLASARTVNPEAYDAYQKGSSLWKTLKPTDLDAAQRFFELALEKDSSYAPAYEGLTWVWLIRQQWGNTPSREAGPKAKEAALQAIALDENSAEAHEALASVMAWSDWNWASAEPEWKRALELNPNSANAHAYYAHFLAQRGRANEAIQHSQLAIKLDPFNALYHGMYGMVLIYLRRYDDALAAAHSALALRPDLGIGFSVIQRVYIVLGMHEEQLADQRLRIAGDPERITAFERGLEEGGYEGAQRGIADVLAARYKKSQYDDAIGVALRYLDAGDNDQTIDWLYKAYEVHDPALAYIGMPPWDRLQSDPRYQALLRRIGLPLDEKK